MRNILNIIENQTYTNVIETQWDVLKYSKTAGKYDKFRHTLFLLQIFGTNDIHNTFSIYNVIFA